MAQLQKKRWKLSRNKIPCTHCGENHPTRMHGKNDQQQIAEARSRNLNANDRLQ